MNLSRFITENMESILVEWEAFARMNVPDAADMSALALRNHAKQMLQDIAVDIETPQTVQQQRTKSQGRAPARGPDTAAGIHGSVRHASDYTLLQLSAEFRALRATVLRMWLPKTGEMTDRSVDEMIRFNEAVDQAFAESIVTYSLRAGDARDLFLAILGHDLRSPLATMALSGSILARPQLTLDQVPAIAGTVDRAARLMGAMIEDLIGYTRTQLGKGMPIALKKCDLREICEAAVEDSGATHPGTKFDLDTSGRMTGRFDCVRLHQLLVNLLVNAAQHGAKDRPVTVEARGDEDAATVRVTNFGNAISEASLQSIFKPLIQLSPADDSDTRPKTSLGLGLFIAREIAEGHGGTIDVTSSEAEGTTFTVRLPWVDANAGDVAD
jgi:signal transduction histidine kinase